MSRALFAVGIGLLSFCPALFAADGPGTAELLTELKSSDQQARLQAIDALGERGEATLEVLQALSEQMRDPSPKIRAHAAHALGHFGPAARPAVEALAPLVADKDADVRRMAIRAWAAIRPGPDVSIPLLSKVLEDADPAVHAHVLTLLAEVGKPAVPALAKALKHEKAAFWACIVLSDIGPDAAEAVPALTDVLQNNADPAVRREAAAALGAIGPAAATAVPALVKSLDEHAGAVCCGAAYALGRIGPQAKAAEEALNKCCEGKDEFLKTVAAWALAKIEPGNEARREKALALLAAALKSKNQQFRALAVRGMVDLKAKAETILSSIMDAEIAANDEIVGELLVVSSGLGKPAVPLLIESLSIERFSPLAASLLGEMGPDAAEAVEHLVDLAANGKTPARCEALLALGTIAPDSAEAVETAANALDDPEEDIRYAACFALGKIGKPAAPVVPALTKLLADKDEFLALASAWALAHVDPKSAEIAAKSVPLLIGGLKEREPRVRFEAAVALGCLGPLAKDAMPALKAAARDKDEFVRNAAEDALESIGR